MGIPGKTLNFTHYYGSDKETFYGYRDWCKPYNCSNKACYNKGCAEARKLYCKKFGKRECKGVRICEGDKCVGAIPTRYGTCAETLAEQNITGKPFCEDVRRGNVPPPSGGSPSGQPYKPPAPYKAPAGCQCGCDIENPFFRSLSCVGYNLGGGLSRVAENFGNFATDAARTGGQQMPLYIMLGLGVVLLLVLRK